MKRPVIKLPFGGFYESMWSREIDHCVDMLAEYEAEKEGEDGTAPELRINVRDYGSVLFDATDYSQAYRQIAEDYVQAFDGNVSREISVPLKLKFESMASPKYYNFETDRVFAFTTWKAMKALLKMSKKDKHTTLAKVIKERCTSYSGFHSWYPNDINVWLAKPFKDWDHNELEILMIACLVIAKIGDVQNEAFERMVESNCFDQAFDQAVDWNKFEAKRAELRADLVAEAQKTDPSYVVPPVWCQFTPDLFKET